MIYPDLYFQANVHLKTVSNHFLPSIFKWLCYFKIFYSAYFWKFLAFVKIGYIDFIRSRINIFKDFIELFDQQIC